MANIFSWISNKIASVRGGGKFLSTRMWGMGTTEVYPTGDVTTALNQGFKGNTAVYSIVKKAAKKFGTIPRYVEKKDKVDEKADNVVEGALMDLLNRPNSMYGQDAFFSLVYAFYKVCGEAFICLNRGDTDVLVDDQLIALDDEAHMKKPVLEMFVIAPNHIVILPDPDDPFGVIGYQLTDMPSIKFRKVDMIHWKDINLDFDISSRIQLRGFSPLVAGIKTLTQNNSATDAAVRMYQNSGAKGVMTEELSGQRTPVQQTQLKDIFDNKINNHDVKGTVQALQGKWSYHNLGLTSVDMELLEGKDYSMKELCFLLGMPFDFFDPHTPYAEKQLAQRGWVINEIIPDCKQLDGEMNRLLLPAFGLDRTSFICSDFDQLHELQEDKKSMAERLMLTPHKVDEIREALREEKIGGEEGDIIIIPSGFQSLGDLNGDGGGDILTQVRAMQKPTNGVKK